VKTHHAAAHLFGGVQLQHCVTGGNKGDRERTGGNEQDRRHYLIGAKGHPGHTEAEEDAERTHEFQ